MFTKHSLSTRCDFATTICRGGFPYPPEVITKFVGDAPLGDPLSVTTEILL